MGSLYLITRDCQELYDKLIDSLDSETGEIDGEIANALAVKQEEFENKALNVAGVVRMFENKSEEIDREIERLTAIKDKVDNTVGRLKTSLSTACQALGFEKIEGIHAKISFRKSEKTVIDNLEEIPYDYKISETKYKADLNKIKKAINEGKAVPGAHLEENKSIQIK